MTNEVKVLIIGGGAAGLAAAVELERAGVSCQVLEAQARLGGRVHSVSLESGVSFERGAQIINGDMNAVLALAKEADLHLSPVPAVGEDLCVVNGDVVSRDTLVSADEIETLLSDAIRSWSSPREATRSVMSLYRWWSSPWEDLDEAKRGVKMVAVRDTAPRGSLGAAIRQLLLCPEDEAIARTMMAEQYGADPDAINALAVRRSLDSYGSERRDLEFQIPAGMSKVISTLAAKLSPPPILKTPVTDISNNSNCLVVTAGDQQWRADHVIVAVPPPIAQKIPISIANGDRLSGLLGAFAPGDMIKTTLTYDRPFWRAEGLSGAVTFAAPLGLEVLDTSYHANDRYQLTAFLGGPEARRRARLCKGEREDLLISDVSKALGKATSRPVQVNEAVWVDDRWSGGGYNAYIKNGHPHDAAQQLAQWPGPVRFAGAELDDTFAGYVEGALRSGRRVARDIATELAVISQ
ncbi:NAD(P)/FAD-dependent oxidoreductase [Cognatiyoonia sp. IB215182]|uniref:flavin monoamine oxidase family protein n=1 Tax=Cognatiyoonia sp. IB215182 TaxID=3097353 RepID=UPI002A116471|nr:NAD(P)/FAD-dependent oxidoreductase [Cognatiyoonia sp. IB215182]MDX8355342.1 NAD(P)/FAD-dependent oxidoreductase [Cognatiyoonia sp. IB215182]